MFYTREEKQLLGRYFKYYREEKNITIKDVTSTGICEYRTYKKIEDGKIKNNDELFDALLNYFSIDSKAIEVLRNVQPLIDDLYDACEWYDKDRILKVTKLINRNLNLSFNTPIINELLNSIEIINKEYVLNEKFEEEELLYIIKLIDLFNNKCLSSLLVEVCGKNNLNYVCSNRIFDLMEPIVNRNDHISIYWKAKINVYKSNYSAALEIYLKLYNHYDYKKNNIRKVRIVMQLFNIYRDIDKEKAKEYADKLESILEDGYLPENIARPIYYNLGMYFYMNNKFEKALCKFEKSNKIQENQTTILFICACRSRLNKIECFNFKIDDSYPYSAFLYYYKMKLNKENEKELECYIFSHLMNILMKEKYEYPFWNMFSYELTELVKKTRNYKKYLEFQEKMQFVTKNAT